MLVGWFFVYTSLHKLCTIVASYARSYPQGHSTLQAHFCWIDKKQKICYTILVRSYRSNVG